MKPHLNSSDLIELQNNHKDNIGKDKATYSEGVLFGYGIKSQVPCRWKVQYEQNGGFLYIVGCSGEPQASMVDIDDMDKTLFCHSCGHRVEIER